MTFAVEEMNFSTACQVVPRFAQDNKRVDTHIALRVFAPAALALTILA
jgi:hypothetical protein